MKKETIYIKQKVILEYENEKGRKEAIKQLRLYPNAKSVGCGEYGWRKADEPPRIIIQILTPIKQ